MSINPQFQGHDQYDVMLGSVTSHFAQIDNVLLKNECIDGQYQLVTAASYAANTPVDAPGFTTVNISTTGALVADLENSYITAELQYTLKLPGYDPTKAFISFTDPLDPTQETPKTPCTKYFIGFKQSLDALRRYDVYVNAQEIYSQAFVGNESFIQVAGLNDTIITKNPFVYTSYKNASTMDNNVCGVYVDLATLTANEQFTISIPIKINMHQFLMLSAIHYLPSFCGRWELKLYFDANNLIICPVNPLAYTDAQIHPIITKALHVYTAVGNEWNGFSNHFTQILDDFYAIVDAGQNGTGNAIYGGTFDVNNFVFTYTKTHLECSRVQLTQCLMNITQFQLKYEVYEGLIAHYTEQPLIIPINLLTYQRFSHSNSSDSAIHAVANLPVENCDSIFLLFPTTANQTTCFYQPYLRDCRLGMGQFGVKPSQYVSTFDDPRFVGLTLDALNLEMSKISAMNQDFANSILPHTRLYDAKNGTHTSLLVHNNPLKDYDSSYFMYGLSCSQVGFQSGTVSSGNTNINFQFDATIAEIPGIEGQKKNFKVPIVAMFLQDGEIIIQVMPNTDHPVVKVSTRSVV